MVKNRRTNRYCIDCGGRLVYYPRLSNPKASNEQRVLVYACPDCSTDMNKPKMLSYRTGLSDDPITTVEVEVTKIRGD